jgi:uncharacterized tellurite resistance protein B-like protein
MNADGVLDEDEMDALRKICDYENIPGEVLAKFISGVPTYTERQIYKKGLKEIGGCSDEEKVKTFAWLHRISDADGNVHVKEVRFLLYSMKKAGIEFEDVTAAAKKFPSLL